MKRIMYLKPWCNNYNGFECIILGAEAIGPTGRVSNADRL